MAASGIRRSTPVSHSSFRVCGRAQTACKLPPRASARRAAPTSAPSPAESMNVTRFRSTISVPPLSASSNKRSRNQSLLTAHRANDTVAALVPAARQWPAGSARPPTACSRPAGRPTARQAPRTRHLPRRPGGGRAIATAAQTRYPGHHAWVWPAAAAIAAIIALLALYWLLIQARTRTVRRLSLEPERTHGVTVLPADAVTSAITDELKTRPGIHRAAAALKGSPGAPGLQLSVTAADHTDPALLRGYIEREALTHLRASLERDTIPPPCYASGSSPPRTAPCYDPGVSRNGE